MRRYMLIVLLLPVFAFSAEQPNFSTNSHQLSLEGAKEMANRVMSAAKTSGKNITIAIVGAQGETILIYRGDGVGPHNKEAARRKAFTSLSTKTATLLLARNARSNPDTANLAELPELLLLGGGQPLWKAGTVIGAIGVAGGGGPEIDDSLASKANLPEASITTGK